MNSRSFKDSAVAWIGKIPSNWDIKPLFTVMTESQKKNIDNKESNVLSLSYGKIIRREVKNNFGLLPESFETYQIVQPGNIVLRLLDLQNDHVSLRTGLVNETGIVTSAYVALELQENLDPSYAAYLLHDYDILKVFYGFGGGVRQSMKFEDLKRLPIVYPSIGEQRRIVAYLDEQTAKIDNLLSLRHKQIDLLKMQQASIIQHAVTRGLNPNAQMKDSGISWLSEIPFDWKVTKLKYISPQITVGIVINPSSYYVDHGIPCLRSLNVRPGELVPEDLVYISPESHKLLNKSAVYQGDVVAVRTGQPGTAAVIDEQFHNANCIDLIIIRQASSFFVSDYLQILLNSSFAKAQFELGSDGAIQQHFNIQTAKNLDILLPPLEQQNQILEYLNNEIGKLYRTSTTYSRQIEVLQEYRSALIHECVTGQREVP